VIACAALRVSSQALRGAVSAALARGERPLVLGGDCAVRGARDAHGGRPARTGRPCRHGSTSISSPAGLTLDIGCGEGRFARELHRSSYEVVGVDSSPTLACAARTASPEIEVIEADVARLDFDDGVAHLAVACMSLLNIDELDTVLSEIARVLAPAGHFCFATLHPSTSFDYVLDRDPDASYSKSGPTSRQQSAAACE
jgi:SAM-dependent methyltransferase